MDKHLWHIHKIKIQASQMAHLEKALSTKPSKTESSLLDPDNER